jgi:exopolysaccharide biosynthesis polyprenyl glycosylphosphotransferase
MGPAHRPVAVEVGDRIWAWAREGYLVRRHLLPRRAQGRLMKRVLIVGSTLACSELADRLRSAPHVGLFPVGACCGKDAGDLGVAGPSMPVLGEPVRALNAALTIRADAIAIADAETLAKLDLGQLAAQLGGTEIELLVHSGLADVAGPQISVRPVVDVPLAQVELPRLKFGPRVVKRVADRLVALIGLLVLAPLLVAIALVIRVSSGGPVIFRQVRVGLGGRHFKVWKFRTMVRDAESSLSSLMHLNEQDGVLFKMRNDPRVTAVGRVLRRWSLDELPQLWNVLRGDMSLVGPRPPIPSEVDRYDDRVHRRLLVKPGMTGLWQVSGRAELLWEEAVRLDLHYVEHWSLGMDAAILGRTCVAVVRQRGAY